MEQDSLEKINRDKDSGDSVEEMKALIERYHKLLIEREKQFSLMLSDEVDSSYPLLKKHYRDYTVALIIEAGVRLLIILTLWIFLMTQLGFSWRLLAGLLISITLYICFEVFGIMGKLSIAHEAVYR